MQPALPNEAPLPMADHATPDYDDAAISHG
jgi:hypothetical protein